MKTIKHTHINQCPSVAIRMDVEQMLFRTDKDGFYALAESEFNKERTIRELNELLEVEVVPEMVEDSAVVLRVFAVEYTIEVRHDRCA